MVSSGIVPVIDFEPFLSGTPAEKEATARELLKAAKEVRGPASSLFLEADVAEPFPPTNCRSASSC